MARFKFGGTWHDRQGAVISGGTITVYLAGTTTLATAYESETGSALTGSATTTDADGAFEFWIDDGDFASTQRFRIIGTKTFFADLDNSEITDNLQVIPTTPSSFEDDSFTLVDDGDNTKKMVFELSGITTATTRTLTVPDANDTIVGKATTDTFTNKTFDANATGNSLSNVDVADLADGTDGELITWDASGNAATVAVGTSAQVLTSNGSGAAPTMQDTSVVSDTTPQLGGDLDGQDNQVQKVILKDYHELTVANAAPGTTETLDIESGNVFHMTLDDNITFTFSNPIASDDTTSFTLFLRQDGGGGNTTTWPASVDWADGTAPTLVTTGNSVSILVFFTIDGGTIWHGAMGSADSK